MKRVLCNKYEMIKCIGEGGMGSVYLAKDRHLNRNVAVKVCKKSDEENIADSIVKEKEVLQKLSHPALPLIYDFFEEEGRLFLVMEYVEGTTLGEFLEKHGKVEEQKAVRWGIAIAEVLSYLHGQNPPIIYRDLKPSNIMVQPDGRIRLIDFGTAYIFNAGLLKERLLMGTPGYSAPEQLKDGCCSKEADIYALGAVLHELLTGVWGSKHIGMKRPVREYDIGVSKAVEKIVMKCMRDDPAMRYQSSEQLKEELLSCQKKVIGKRRIISLHNVVLVGVWVVALFRFFLPLIKGIPVESFPFPFLKEPLCYFAVVLLFQKISVCYRNKKSNRIKVEKSILLTEKKYSGWYLGFFVVVLATVLFSKELPVKSAEENKELWVELRDEENRKLLLREGATYHTRGRIRFDIPDGSLPRGKLSMQILAVDEAGEIYESRVFLVEGN